jgi:hypothetical protein
MVRASGIRCFGVLLAKSVRNIDVPIPSEYVRGTLPLTQLIFHAVCLFTVVVLYAHLHGFS